jgi:hypothetical protein
VGLRAPWVVQYHLDEYTTRINRLKSRTRGKLFLGLIEKVVATASVICQVLIVPAGKAFGITFEEDEFGG